MIRQGMLRGLLALCFLRFSLTVCATSTTMNAVKIASLNMTAMLIAY